LTTTPDTDEPTPEQVNELLTLLAAVQAARRRAWWRVGIGLAVALAAALMSLATYAEAGEQAAQTGTGTYYLWWGPIVFGGWMALRAAWALFRLRY
jgi:ferric-dicitrate binding protein FerR (iron transport regulator)